MGLICSVAKTRGMKAGLRSSMLSLLAILTLFLVVNADAQESLPKPIGWRGNYTGQFPDSKIPITWRRVSKLLAGVHTQAKRPKADIKSGTAASHGAISEWLVLGAFTPQAGAKPIEQAFVDKEEDLQPDEGQSVADKTWRLVRAEENLLNLEPLFENPQPGQVAYAHAYLHSTVSGKVKFRANAEFAEVRVLVNGKPLDKNSNATLAEGWNRVLCKVTRAAKQKYETYVSYWKLETYFYALAPYEWESQNIVWATRLPNWGGGCPIIVGDRLLAMSESSELVCLDKSSGKLLWIRSNHYHDAATPEERKADPAFQEMEPVLARLKIINDAFCSPAGPAPAMYKEKGTLEDQLLKLQRQLSKEKYHLQNPQTLHTGYCIPTPCSDGKYVYVWVSSGVAACYDLESNRKWITFPGHEGLDLPFEHCYPSSPTLADGKMIGTLQETIAFDCKTGAVAWRNRDCFGPKRLQASLVPFQIQGQDAIFGNYMIFRASDGKVLWSGKPWFTHACSYLTPIIQQGTVYELNPYAALRFAKLPEAMGDTVTLSSETAIDVVPEVGAKNPYNRRMVCASPLIHEGLLYTIDSIGRLRVIELQSKTLLYEQHLAQPEHRSQYHHMGSFYASPILAGKRLYFLSSTGTTFVLEPGRTFKLVAINKLENNLAPAPPRNWFEHPEHFVGSPVCDGDRLYIRGDDTLYCIGEK